MRVIFMGTPTFAVPTLQALVGAGYQVTLAVTQAARPAGRGRRPTHPPVAIAAAELGVPVYQPERIRDREAADRIAEDGPDAIVVAAYGQILRDNLLALPRYGCLNVHASLLPRHRGASPISAAILAGDEITGASIMLMETGLDTGPVLSRAPTGIQASDDQVTLTEQLAAMGADLLVETLGRWSRGEIQPEAQDESQATTTLRVTRAEGVLDWKEPAESLWRRVRAYAEWPQGLAVWQGKLLRILRAHYDERTTADPGVVLPWGRERLRPVAAAIGTAKGVLLPDVLLLEGRRPIAIDAFLRGYPSFIGSRLAVGDTGFDGSP